MTISPTTRGAVKYTTRAMRRPRGDSGTLKLCMRCLSDRGGAAAAAVDAEDDDGTGMAD